MVRRSWRTQLKASTSDVAVLAVVRQFLDEWSPGEVSALPPDAWPREPISREVVLQHSMRLAIMHAAFSDASSSLHAVQELLLFFTHASVRIVSLAAAVPSPQPSRAAGKALDEPR